MLIKMQNKEKQAEYDAKIESVNACVEFNRKGKGVFVGAVYLILVLYSKNMPKLQEKFDIDVPDMGIRREAFIVEAFPCDDQEGYSYKTTIKIYET